MWILVICVLVFNFVLTSNAQSENFYYKPIPSKLIQKNNNSCVLRDSVIGNSKRAYNLVDCLPENYRRDGTVDYTSYIQRALNIYKKVIFPDFPLLIGPQGLTLKSNSVLIFRDSSRLVMTPNDKYSYAIIKLYDINNVKLYFPVIVGEREKHFGTEGQWGMGISIRGSSDIEVYYPKISNCWGDGIYIGSYKNRSSRNISVKGGVLDYNRRNGISIVSGNFITIDGTIISNTYGHTPMSGIDIEPNSNIDIIDNVILEGITTFNNGQRGILVNLNRLLGKNRKSINITVNKHIDIGSRTSMFLAISMIKNGIPLTGSIKVIGSKWINNSKPFVYYNGPENNMTTVFENISVFKVDSIGREVPWKTVIPQIKNDLERYKNIKFK